MMTRNASKEVKWLLWCGGVVGALSVDYLLSLAIRRISRKDATPYKSKLSAAEACAILREMSIVNYPTLTDLCNITNPLLQKLAHAESSGGSLTPLAILEDEEVKSRWKGALLSSGTANSLLEKEKAVLESHGITDHQEFVKAVNYLSEINAEVSMLQKDLLDMIDDAVAGRLPLMPQYKMHPIVSKDQVLKVLGEIQSSQRLGIERILKHFIQRDCEEASTWLPKAELADEDSLLNFFNPPDHVAKLLRQELKAREDDIISLNRVTIGDRHNFNHALALFSRDSDFARKWNLQTELHESEISNVLHTVVQYADDQLILQNSESVALTTQLQAQAEAEEEAEAKPKGTAEVVSLSEAQVQADAVEEATRNGVEDVQTQTRSASDLDSALLKSDLREVTSDVQLLENRDTRVEAEVSHDSFNDESSEFTDCAQCSSSETFHSPPLTHAVVADTDEESVPSAQSSLLDSSEHPKAILKVEEEL